MATKEQELLRRMISHNLTAYSKECEGTESPSHRARCEADSSHQQRVASEAAKASASTSGAASSKESPLGPGAGFVTPEDRVKKRVREDSEIPTEPLGATAISKLLDDSQIFEESDPEPDQQVMKKPAANTRKRPAASGVPSECATEAAVPAAFASGYRSRTHLLGKYPRLQSHNRLLFLILYCSGLVVSS